MELFGIYVIGTVFIMAGLGLKALAVRQNWLGEQRGGRTVADVVIISLTTTIYLFNIVIFLGLLSAFDALGVGAVETVYAAWFATFGLVAECCTLLGWQVGQRPVAKPKLPDPFADGSANPFGTDEAAPSDLDFNGNEPRRP